MIVSVAVSVCAAVGATSVTTPARGEGVAVEVVSTAVIVLVGVSVLVALGTVGGALVTALVGVSVLVAGWVLSSVAGLVGDALATTPAAVWVGSSDDGSIVRRQPDSASSITPQAALLAAIRNHFMAANAQRGRSQS